MADKNSMIFYYDWLEDFEDMTPEEVGLLTVAIMQYETQGVEAVFEDRAMRAVFRKMKHSVDENKERYADRVEANRANGKKGGRPKTQKPNGFSVKTQKPDTDPDTDTDTDIDTDSDNARAREAGPDREKVKDYFVRKGKPEEAEPFYNYYSAINWMIAGQPVKYWAKLADKWIANIRAPAKKAHNFTQRTDSYAAVEAKIFNK